MLQGFNEKNIKNSRLKQKSLYNGEKFRPKNSSQNRGFIHYKNIKAIVQKQLKKQYPNWHRLSRKFKEEISRKVLAHFVSGYDFSQEITKPPEKLLGIEQQVSTNEIITLENMAEYISSAKNSRIVKFCDYMRSPIYVKDKDGTLFSETGTIVTTPPSAKVALPKHTDGDTGAVFCHDECPFPMVHAEIEGQNHGYKCSATPCSCI